MKKIYLRVYCVNPDDGEIFRPKFDEFETLSVGDDLPNGRVVEMTPLFPTGDNNPRRTWDFNFYAVKVLKSVYYHRKITTTEHTIYAAVEIDYDNE